MELVFVGADHEVTGSCHYLRVGGSNILIDYGMEQGKNVFENAPLPVKPENIDYVLLTHAHIDHTGMLPKLYADGFRGRIICTKATRELSDIMLRDSAHIQQQEAEYQNRKAGRKGSSERAEPVYTMQNTMDVLRLFESYPYNQRIHLCEGVDFRFTDVGHLLGSASIELWLSERGEERKVVFSGDIGNKNQPLLRDPQPTTEADYVVMESTYGDRLHEKTKGDHVRQLADAIRTTLPRGGNLVIPAFAVGRTQVMLYFIKQIKEQNLVPECPDFPVYVDSPLAVEATGVFENNEIECFDEEARAMLDAGINPLQFPNLHLSITTEESIAINTDTTPKVIISASGMCDAGRIKHHIKHNIGNPRSTILFVGYQAEGTLGRRLLDGVEKIRIFGEDYNVLANVIRIDGLSGHADRDGLLEWIGNFSPKPKQVFVVHGDDETATAFEECLVQEHEYKAMAPYSGTKYDLISGRFIRIAKPKRISGGSGQGGSGDDSGGSGVGSGGSRADIGGSSGSGDGNRQVHAGSVRGGSSSYTKLKIATKRLNGVVEASSGLPNKELDRFTKELNDLCRKYQTPGT